MRLSFSVLWFDDSEDYFDSLDIDPLEQEIMAWGFSPDIKMVTTSDEFYNYSPYSNFDLIIVDRNLEEYPDGQYFIAELRENAIYTEVIFYTAGNASELWDDIREKKLEGVYVSHRNDILPKITKVGLQSIRKVLDLENMRGILMAEVGELDHLLDEIIIIGIASLHDEEQKIFFQKFYQGVAEQSRIITDRLEAFSKNPEISEMIDLCDSDKRWRNYNRLRKSHGKLKSRKKIGDYEKDILVPRNILAHGRPEPHNEGFKFHHKGKEFLFNDSTSLNLRQTILRYKFEFSQILGILNNGQ